ncbi:hypothetical protein [Lonsdalea britannica]|uniref:hypothetical protein n=1 Tax=Lonsdalea britannica TaxID=1082704 RepID=UPI00111BF578|nr:hypothetical protein [Lonsdalea britannica]
MEQQAHVEENSALLITHQGWITADGEPIERSRSLFPSPPSTAHQMVNIQAQYQQSPSAPVQTATLGLSFICYLRLFARFMTA